MISSIFQKSFPAKVLQLEFHPFQNNCVILDIHGRLEMISSSGETEWRLDDFNNPLQFQINKEGHLIAVLSTELLHIIDLIDFSKKTFPIDPKITKIDFYKNCIALGGYQKNIDILSLAGRIIKKIEYDDYIHNFKIVEGFEKCLLHTGNQHLIAIDIDSEVDWLLKNYRITSPIIMDNTGKKGCFVRESYIFMIIYMDQDYLYELDLPSPPVLFDLSHNGQFLIIYDAMNHLTCYDHESKPIWTENLQIKIADIKLSASGDQLMVLDADNIVSVYDCQVARHKKASFLEVRDQKRVIDKESTWECQPGSYTPKRNLDMLTPNTTGTGFSVIGQNGQIYFFDQKGEVRYSTKFMGLVRDIGMDELLSIGYITGDRSLMIIDLKNRKHHYIDLPYDTIGLPCVNFFRKQVVQLLQDNALIFYDFSGKTLKKKSLKAPFKHVLSIDVYGYVLHGDKGILGMSEKGNPYFTFTKKKVNTFFFIEENLIFFTDDNAVFNVNLDNMRTKKREFGKSEKYKLLSFLDNICLVSSGLNFILLNQSLEIVAEQKIKSSHSYFYEIDEQMIEILEKVDGIFAYNKEGEILWRYTSKEKIEQSALLLEGVVIRTEKKIRFIPFDAEKTNRYHMADYLEF